MGADDWNKKFEEFGRKKLSGPEIIKVLGLLVCFVALLAICGEDDPPAPAPAAQKISAEAKAAQDAQAKRERLGFEACDRAQDAVKGRLKAPATAEFPGCFLNMSEYQIRGDEQMNKIIVLGHVDAQNSFGALLRTQFGVEFERLEGPGGDDTWRVVSVALDE